MVAITAISYHDESMELRQLAYAVAVAETGSFTRAAHRCFVVQSALSHQIARLEDELGTRLFERTSRRVQITRPARCSWALPGKRWRPSSGRAAK